MYRTGVLLLMIGAMLTLGMASDPTTPPEDSSRRQTGPAQVSGSSNQEGAQIDVSDSDEQTKHKSGTTSGHRTGPRFLYRYTNCASIGRNGNPYDLVGTLVCAETIGCDPDPVLLVRRQLVAADGTVVEPWRQVGTICGSSEHVTLNTQQIRSAFTSVPWAELTTIMAPPNNLTLVTVPVYYQTSWADEGISPGETITLDPARMLGYHVELRPILIGYTYHFGDGTSFGPTTNPGGTYPTGTITHEYPKPGTYTVRIDATLSAEYRLTGQPWTRIPDTVTVPGATTTMQVKTARAILVN